MFTCVHTGSEGRWTPRIPMFIVSLVPSPPPLQLSSLAVRIALRRPGENYLTIYGNMVRRNDTQDVVLLSWVGLKRKLVTTIFAAIVCTPFPSPNLYMWYGYRRVPTLSKHEHRLPPLAFIVAIMTRSWSAPDTVIHSHIHFSLVYMYSKDHTRKDKSYSHKMVDWVLME